MAESNSINNQGSDFNWGTLSTSQQTTFSKQDTMPRLQSLLFALVAVSSTVLAAVNDPCTVNGTPGICIASTSCSSSGGTSSSQPDCPNDPEDIKCCTKGCGTGGTCMFSSSCTGGTSTANLCPGPANFQCCTPSAGGGGGAPPPPSGGRATDLSAHGVAFIAGFEGFRGDFYNDAAVSEIPLWCYDVVRIMFAKPLANCVGR